ncbi:MAG: hypothetical protein ABJC74_08780 [Gemmatimonadota bacterium]
MSSTLITPIVAIFTGLILFSGFWLLITTALSSFSGWTALAEAFPGGERPAGEILRGQILGFGPIRENNVTNLIATPSGLYLYPMALFAFRRPPILIPYSKIKYLETSKVLWSRSHEIEVNGTTRMRIRDRLLQELKGRGVSVPSDALSQ